MQLISLEVSLMIKNQMKFTNNREKSQEKSFLFRLNSRGLDTDDASATPGTPSTDKTPARTRR